MQILNLHVYIQNKKQYLFDNITEKVGGARIIGGEWKTRSKEEKKKVKL